MADTVVGDQFVRGISGGEKRRVSVGVETLGGRTLLLADSPTNGLDAASAFDVIKTARALADTGIFSMMASVRQPSLALLRLFDTVCLVSRGTCLFFGPTDQAETFFKTQGFVRPPTKSIPDFLEEITQAMRAPLPPPRHRPSSPACRASRDGVRLCCNADATGTRPQ